MLKSYKNNRTGEIGLVTPPQLLWAHRPRIHNLTRTPLVSSSSLVKHPLNHVSYRKKVQASISVTQERIGLNDQHFTDGIFEFIAHDVVIQWKLSPCYWPFLRGIHRVPVDFPHKEARSLVVSLICWSAPEQTVEQTIETPSRSLWGHCNIWMKCIVMQIPLKRIHKAPNH